MKSVISYSILLIIFTLLSCAKETNDGNPMPENPTNILLIIADDLGKDAIKGYTEGSIKPNTPHIDAIRNDGLMFTNLWVNPTCSPTRSSILTGKYGYRTNVKGAGDILSPTETSLQKYINQQTNDKYATAIVGKWHLSGNNTNTNPEAFGIDYYAGLIRGTVDDYYQWQLTEDGVTSLQTTYTTEAFTNMSINWLANQTKPWFLWLAYNAPHTPFHVPPSNQHSQGNLPNYTAGMNAIPYYMAAIEAMDYQIGRLLDNIPENQRDQTVIIFVGDNGTPNQVAQNPYTSTKVKNTVYQGGINVPIFISGKNVTRIGIDDNLLNGTDLFTTIAEIAGVDVTQYNDSKSFKSLLTQSSKIRNFQYSELNDGTNDIWTVSNGKYKLIVNANGNKELYLLSNDPYEEDNLMSKTLSTNASTALSSLETELAVIRK